MDSADRKLDALLGAYREACPDVEPGADFMPGVWQRIDAKRGSFLVIRRMAQVFVSAAAALSLAMFLLLLPARQSSLLSKSYLETLDEDQQDSLAFADVLHTGESSLK